MLRGPAEPLKLIPASDAPLYEGLARLGGYAEPDLLRSSIASLANLSLPDLHERLIGCPFVSWHRPGYLLRGWAPPLASQATPVEDADDRLYCVTGQRLDVLLTNSAAQRVKLSERLIYLPAPLPDLLEGTFKELHGRWPPILFTHGRIKRLAPIATALGVPAGARFHLELDLDARVYVVHPDPATSSFLATAPAGVAPSA